MVRRSSHSGLWRLCCCLMRWGISSYRFCPFPHRDRLRNVAQCLGSDQPCATRALQSCVERVNAASSVGHRSEKITNRPRRTMRCHRRSRSLMRHCATRPPLSANRQAVTVKLNGPSPFWEDSAFGNVPSITFCNHGDVNWRLLSVSRHIGCAAGDGRGSMANRELINTGSYVYQRVPRTLTIH
jgi:hypothetical protein